MSEVQRLWTRVVDDAPPKPAGGRHDARDWQERSEHQNSKSSAGRPRRSPGPPGACSLYARKSFDLPHSAPVRLVLRWVRLMAQTRNVGESRGSRRFGITVWLAADEIAMPLLGLSDSTARRPVEMHLQSLVAHLVDGTPRRTDTVVGASAIRRASPDAARGKCLWLPRAVLCDWTKACLCGALLGRGIAASRDIDDQRAFWYPPRDAERITMSAGEREPATAGRGARARPRARCQRLCLVSASGTARCTSQLSLGGLGGPRCLRPVHH